MISNMIEFVKSNVYLCLHEKVPDVALLVRIVIVFLFFAIALPIVFRVLSKLHSKYR